MKIKELIRELGLEVVLAEGLDREGLYIPDLNLIVLRSDLSEEMQQKIILHEIGHHLAHKEGTILYRMQRERLKMEHEADCFMLKEEVKNYLSCNDIDKDNFNAINFLQTNGLSLKFESDVKKIISNL